MMRGAGLFVLGSLVAGPAMASGYIPGFETHDTLGSHAECIARLEAAAEQAAAVVEPKTIRPDGSTRPGNLGADHAGGGAGERATGALSRQAMVCAWRPARRYRAYGIQRKLAGNESHL